MLPTFRAHPILGSEFKIPFLSLLEMGFCVIKKHPINFKFVLWNVHLMYVAQVREEGVTPSEALFILAPTIFYRAWEIRCTIPMYRILMALQLREPRETP